MEADRKLKVALVFDDSLDSSDGVAQQVKTLGAWLSTQGHQVSYLVGQTKLKEWAGGRIYSLAKNLPVRFNGNKLSIPFPVGRASIKKVLEANDFDIIHVMMPYSPFMAQKVINSADKTAAIVGSFHVYPAGRSAKYGGYILGKIYGRSLKKFNSIMAVSSAAQNYARQVFKINSVVVSNMVDLSKFSHTKTKTTENRIVFLGRLVKRKGCEQLIDAFNIASKSDPQLTLTIAGDGAERNHLEAKVKRLGLQPKVKFLGYIEEAAKSEILAQAHIACFPSLYGESFGIVLLEAMAAGSKVILGGDNPGYRSVLDEQPKMLIDPKNTVAFGRRITELIEDKKEAAKLHNWQDQTVRQYDVNIVGKQILDIYRKSIAP